MYNISTIVAIINLNIKIDLTSFIQYFEHNSIISKKNTINFGNQITIELQLDKKINIKIFSNGILQITGLKDNYKEQIDQIVNILKNNTNKKYDTYIKTISIEKHPIGFLIYNNTNIIGYNNNEYKIIGYIKKNNKFFINNNDIVLFDYDNKLYTEFKHKNKEKMLYSINGVLIGKMKYIIVSEYCNKKEYCNIIDLSNISNPFDSNIENNFYERKTHNLIIKNKIMIKYNNNLYILFNKNIMYIINKYYNTQFEKGYQIEFLQNLIKQNLCNYKTEKNVVLKKIYNYIYSFVKIQYNENYLSEIDYTNNKYLNTNSTIDFNFKIFETPITNYTYKLSNINSDFLIKKQNISDTINIKQFILLFTKEYSKDITINYDPTKYPAIKITFKKLSGSVRIFKTFNCKISCKSIEYTNKIYNIIDNFTTANYSSIINNFKEYDSTNEIKLSIDDIF